MFLRLANGLVNILQGILKGWKDIIQSYLRWLGLVLPSGRRLWDHGHVDGAEVLSSHPELKLSENYQR